MSFEIISFITFIIIALLFVRRTRLIAIPLAVLWLVGNAVRDFTRDETLLGCGLLILAVAISAGAIRDRKKLIAQIKG